MLRIHGRPLAHPKAMSSMQIIYSYVLSVSQREDARLTALQFLNVTLSHDNRTVLLNDQPLYPLPTIPTPPAFWTKQYPTNFSNSDLASGLTCPKTNCNIFGNMPNECANWCWRVPIANGRWIHFDYLYITNPSERNEQDEDDVDSEYWDLSIDVLGSEIRSDYPAFNFNGPEQQMLWMLIKGTPIKTMKKNGGGETASDLFDQIGGDNKVYEYQIVDMRLVARAYNFPAKKPLTFFRKIGHFFGTNIWQVPDHRFLYIASEWGDYGKKGTLRNLFGEITHWEAWNLFWIIVGSVISGLTALFALWRLFWWIVSQRNWDGMEHVWENIRRERVVEEEGALLNGEGAYREGGYRDDPEDGGEGGSSPPAYTDTPIMKPLPAKPLPETPTMKPLPEVPLIDA
jgi:hypothetical protein